MTEPMSIKKLPQSVLDQQYTRCALYLSHIEYYESRVVPRLHEGLMAIEFGGSNGFIHQLFRGVDYEIAPNAPEVDIQNLSAYPEGHFDYVILDEVLEHVPRPWVAVEQARRILKPGGTLITSSPFMIAVHKVPDDYWRFTKQAMHVLLDQYSNVETHWWGNRDSVAFAMNGMMVSTRDAIEAGAFDLRNDEKFVISVWAYAIK